MGESKIEWTEQTWNPVVGCSVLSPGCTNCYAMRIAPRTDELSIGCPTVGKHLGKLTKSSNAGPVWTGALRLVERKLLDPLKRKKPTTYFVNSMGDLFHEDCPDEWIDKVLAVMALTPQHTYQVLTKRSGRMREYVNGIRSKIPFLGRMPLERIHLEAAGHMDGDGGFMDELKRHGQVYSLYLNVPWPLPNVWLGVSTEDQERANDRIPDLLATPAAVRFISAEPLLGVLNLRRVRIAKDHHTIIDALDGYTIADSISGSGQERTMLDWVIVGGESGPNARGMHPDWARSLRDQCAASDVPFFFKQHGEWIGVPDLRRLAGGSGPGFGAFDHCTYDQGHEAVRVGKKSAGRLLDGQEHNAMPKVAA